MDGRVLSSRRAAKPRWPSMAPRVRRPGGGEADHGGEAGVAPARWPASR